MDSFLISCYSSLKFLSPLGYLAQSGRAIVEPLQRVTLKPFPFNLKGVRQLQGCTAIIYP